MHLPEGPDLGLSMICCDGQVGKERKEEEDKTERQTVLEPLTSQSPRPWQNY